MEDDDRWAVEEVKATKIIVDLLISLGWLAGTGFFERAGGWKVELSGESWF